MPPQPSEEPSEEPLEEPLERRGRANEIPDIVGNGRNGEPIETVPVGTKECIQEGTESPPSTLLTSEHRDREGVLTRFEWTCNGCGRFWITENPARLKDVEAGEGPSSVDCYKCRPVPPDPKPPANGVPVHAGEAVNV